MNIKKGVNVEGVKSATVDNLGEASKKCRAIMGSHNVWITAALEGSHKNPDNKLSYYTGDKVDVRSRRTTPNWNKFLIGASDTSTASSIPKGQKVGHLTRAGIRSDGTILFKDDEGRPWA